MVTDSYTYFAFGLLKASTGTTTNYFTWIGELGYVRDIETGEYQLHLRQYLPDRARFKSQDPLGLISGPNQYEYVRNKPISATDPSGLGPSDADVIAARNAWEEAKAELQALKDRYRGTPLSSLPPDVQAQIAAATDNVATLFGIYLRRSCPFSETGAATFWPIR